MLWVLYAVVLAGTILPHTGVEVEAAPSTAKKHGSHKLRNPSAADIPQVHIIAHTHDDVGWKKTVDEYYYGTNQTVANGAVQYILDSVIESLIADPNKKFIYVEIAFFYRWWREQDEARQEQVRNLVKAGQLEFVGGGWCMNDEAGAHYNAIIDQMTLGHALINTQFGMEYRPRMAWQIDPFGHSSEQANLFAQMAFDGLYFARADYEDKALRINQSRLEMVWRGSPNNLMQQSDIFTGMFYAMYGSPHDFLFDSRNADPVVFKDDPLLEDMNAKQLVSEFVDLITTEIKGYRTKHIMIPFGGDFQYSAAMSHFKNLDKLIRYVNADGRVNAFYSTPARYLDAVYAEGLTWELKTDDFFPYADRPHGYWTGYFTSRPALKRYVRDSNALLQACKQIETAHGPAPSGADSFLMREAMGVAQHHDAVSGTEQQHVAYDYAKRLAIGSAVCHEVISSHVSNILDLPKQLNHPDAGTFFCTERNISICSLNSNGPFTVIFYNPLGHSRTSKIRVPVAQQSYVIDNQAVLAYATVPVSDAAKHARGNRSDTQYELVITVTLPPTSLLTLAVKPDGERKSPEAPKSNEISSNSKVHQTKESAAAPTSISNEFYTVTFSQDTGGVVAITDKTSGTSLPLQQGFFWYESYNQTKKGDQPSGAYIFRSKGDTAYPVTDDGKCTVSVVSVTDKLEEARQQCGDFVYQTVGLYKGLNHIEFTFAVGPIPFKDSKGKEVVSRFSSNLKTESIFYTDANGRELQKRQRDHRNTWQPNMTVFEHVAGNFYPVNSRIILRDETAGTQLTVLTDSSQAGSSLQDGEVELMVHRRLLVDDHRGVNEPLNETGISGKGLIVWGTHYVQFAPIKSAASLHRPLAQEIMLPPVVMFNEGAVPDTPLAKIHKDKDMAVKAPESLPANVHLLTLERLDFDPKSNASVQRLVRFEHYFEVGEDETLSKPATVNVQEYLQSAFGITVTSMVEMTLSANLPKSQEKRLPWKVAGEESHTGSAPSRRVVRSMESKEPLDDFTITLNPMDIRTFVITVQ